MLALDNQGSIRDFVNRCENTSSIDELETVIENHLKHINVVAFAYVHMPYYHDNTDEVLCCVQMQFGESQPLKELGNRFVFYDHHTLDSLDTDNIEPFWSPAKQHDNNKDDAGLLVSKPKISELGRVLIVPFLDEKLKRGSFVLKFHNQDKILTRLQLSMLKWALQTVHHKYTDMLKDMTTPDEGLTQSEVDVLKWAALGKSDVVIADILAVSPQKVSHYMYNICKKLDVSDRTEASLRGIALGFI